MAQMWLITRRSTKVSWRCPVSGDPDRVPPTLSSATSDERLHKPCVAAVLGNVLELGNYPVSSCSVRLHHIAIDLRKRPVGRRPVPSFPAPRAIPKPQVAGSIPAVGAPVMTQDIGDRCLKTL